MCAPHCPPGRPFLLTLLLGPAQSWDHPEIPSQPHLFQSPVLTRDSPAPGLLILWGRALKAGCGVWCLVLSWVPREGAKQVLPNTCTQTFWQRGWTRRKDEDSQMQIQW